VCVRNGPLPLLFIGLEHPGSEHKLAANTPGIPLRTNHRAPRGRWRSASTKAVRPTHCGPGSPPPFSWCLVCGPSGRSWVYILSRFGSPWALQFMWRPRVGLWFLGGCLPWIDDMSWHMGSCVAAPHWQGRPGKFGVPVRNQMGHKLQWWKE